MRQGPAAGALTGDDQKVGWPVESGKRHGFPPVAFANADFIDRPPLANPATVSPHPPAGRDPPPIAPTPINANIHWLCDGLRPSAEQGGEMLFRPTRPAIRAKSVVPLA